jgi:replicative DNA helicase
MADKRGPKSPMTAEHKAALATGRAEGRIVRDYLEALRINKPKRGRKRTADSIRKRLSAIAKELDSADALTELKLTQEQMDLEIELANFGATVDLTALEKDFIKVARTYSQRQGISYTAWRKVGVEPAVLKAAGIDRTA